MLTFTYEFGFLLVGCLKKMLSFDNKFHYFYVYVKENEIYIYHTRYIIHIFFCDVKNMEYAFRDQ